MRRYFWRRWWPLVQFGESEMHRSWDERRTTVYHEAGHAVVFWLFGEWVESIEIHSDKRAEKLHEWGRVITGKGLNPVDQVSILEGTPMQRPAAASAILGWMAGPFAGDTAADQAEGWFGWLFEQHYEFPQPNSDAAKILQVADAMYPMHDGRKWRYLRMLATWTEELFANADVARVHAALVSKLAGRQRLRGGDAFGVMNAARGRNDVFPILSLGPTWRRRFRPLFRSWRRPAETTPHCGEIRTPAAIEQNR
jgi:hypothetical protein